MWCSTFTTITRHNRPNISEFENEWRTNNLLGRSQDGWSDCFYNFSYTNWQALTKFWRRGGQETVLGHFRLTFKPAYIHTGWYVKESGDEAKAS
jgi:hypothetical protein